MSQDSDEEEESSGSFKVLAEKTLPSPVRPELFSWCPSMDLLTFSPDQLSIWLYRMSGQLVWKLNLKVASAGISRITWKPDGKMLALACDDGIIRVCDVNNGRIVHQISTETSVSCLNWVVRDKAAAKDRERLTFEGLLNMDVSSSLPRLSPIPTNNASDSIFASKAVLDSMINTSFNLDEAGFASMDVLITGDSTSQLLFNIFGYFQISSNNLPSEFAGLTPINHVSTADLSFHSFVGLSPANDLVLIPLRVHFIRRFGNDLTLVSSASKNLQALGLYIADMLNAIESEWKAFVKATGTMFAMLADYIKKTGSDARPELRLFELLMTGQPDDAVKQWLATRISDRVIRALKKASMNVYENMRRLLNESLIPACERAVIIISRLRGLARWQERGAYLGLNAVTLSKMLNDVTLIMSESHKMVWDLNKEYEHHLQFVSWLKFAHEEVTDAEPPKEDDPGTVNIETRKVATFLTKYHGRPTIDRFFSTKSLDHNGENIDSGHEEGQSGLKLIFASFQSEFKQAFTESADTLKNHVVFGTPIRICKNVLKEKLQIRSRIVQQDSDISMIIALSLSATQELFLLRFAVSDVSSKSIAPDVQTCRLKLPNKELKSFEFMNDDKVVCLLVESSSSAEILSFDVSASKFSDQSVDTTNFVNDATLAVLDHVTSVTNRDDTLTTPLQSRKFTGNDFMPVSMAINDRAGRRVGAIVSDDLQRFQIFDLDDDDDDDDDDDGSEMDE
ncbi:anaphase-promoting complex, cyclosome, subunit 4-domain-containing protein [Lipomyces japonicus]|uniref:anaphase-promoting complex, cyclosome, subunit 4-domain-containing protein n=1 Tax=Lipomyces japonicus TaxID=56871 RepID=UPI0034CE9F22